MTEILSLNDFTGFTQLQNNYNKNKHKPWKEWLKLEKIIGKPGKQGVIGIMVDNNGNKYFFKMSQYINYLVYHEFSVINGLNEISSYCPHFCKGIGIIAAEVDAHFRESKDPFKISGKHSIEQEIMLTEFIDESSKLFNYIISDKIKDNVMYSSIKQVIMAIAIAQREKKFTHYDLHSDNIMMKQCNKDVVFLYVLDEENQFCIPTNGHYPVIIDFGFSYIGDMENNPCWQSLGHTQVGFISDRFDWVADPKLFLVTMADEMWENRKNKKSRKFKNIVKNIFYKFKIEWDSGWDKGGKMSAADYVLNMLEGYNKSSRLFKDYDHYCFDLVQSLVILPLEEQNYENIHISYKTFINEFAKIENEIGNPFYNLYILKGITDFARQVHSDYLSKNKIIRDGALSFFRKSVFQRIKFVADYCVPKNVHYEKMLCSLLCLAKNMEGVLYDAIEGRMNKKEKEYKRMPVNSIEQIYAALDANFKDKYEFSSDTVLYVFDCKNKSCEKVLLNYEDCEVINKTDSFCRGSVLYDIYKNN